MHEGKVIDNLQQMAEHRRRPVDKSEKFNPTFETSREPLLIYK